MVLYFLLWGVSNAWYAEVRGTSVHREGEEGWRVPIRERRELTSPSGSTSAKKRPTIEYGGKCGNQF
jgi:hypothetical protein